MILVGEPAKVGVLEGRAIARAKEMIRIAFWRRPSLRWIAVAMRIGFAKH